MPITEAQQPILESTALAHIATIGPNGEPQVSPVWFSWDGTNLLFSQTTTRQKYRNLQRDPHIAISLVDPTNPYNYLEIRGRVVSIENDVDNAFINSMAKKYMGQDVYPWASPTEQRVVVAVTPEHTSGMGG